MSKPTTLIKRLVMSGLLATVLGAMLVGAFVYQDTILGTFVQTQAMPNNAAPLVKVLADLPTVPAPTPVQKQLLPPAQGLVIRNVMAIKDAEQRLALAKLENELDQLAHQQTLRDMELENQQWLMAMARSQAIAKVQPSEAALPLTNNAVSAEVSDKPLTHSATKPQSTQSILSVKNLKTKPKLLGILSDNRAVLWFNNQQQVINLKQTIGPVTLVRAHQQRGAVDILFNGRSTTLLLSSVFTRASISSLTDHGHGD
jgi:hypothetical protein